MPCKFCLSQLRTLAMSDVDSTELPLYYEVASRIWHVSLPITMFFIRDPKARRVRYEPSIVTVAVSQAARAPTPDCGW